MEPDMPVTMTQQEEMFSPVMLADTSMPQAPPKPEVANRRAEKADLGLGESLGQSREYFREMIRSGREQELRESAASTLTFQAASRKEAAIREAANRKGSGLTYEEALKIIDPFNPANKPADPVDVIEKAYASRFISSANTAASYLQSSVLSDAKREVPEQAAIAEGKASQLGTNIEFTRRLYEDVTNELENQGMVPWMADVAKTMFQPYNEWKLRGLSGRVGSLAGGLLLGENLKNQIDTEFMLPTYTKWLGETIDRLRKDNPTLAKQVLEYALHPDTTSRLLDNTFTILSPFDYAAIGKGSLALTRKIAVNNRANNAMKQIVEAGTKQTDEVPVKSVLQEASGDIKGGGATRAADEISKALEGNLNPVQDIKSKFSSNFRLDGDLLDSNPGKLTRHELTTLKDSFYSAGTRLYDAIVQGLKVNRTSVPLASEEAIKAYQAEARNLFPGEIILDIGSPRLMRETNTYHIPFEYGNAEGRLFPDPETAYNYARMRGYADPRIMSATGDVEKVPAKLVGNATDLKNKVRLEKTIPETERFVKERQAFLKLMNSRNFVGPRNIPEIEETKKWVADMNSDTLPRMRKQLEDINKKVITSDPVIEQNGVGYKFVVIRPYNETDEVVRKYQVADKNARSTASAQGFDSWKNSFLGWVRGADDTLSYNETLNRKIATYTQTLVREWAKDEAKAIEELANRFKWYKPQTWAGKVFGTNKETFNQWNETVKFAKTVRDPATGDLGYFFKTPGEIEDHYQRYYQRLPSFQEVNAYFAHVKLVEGNRILSEIAEFRNRARLGAEQHQFFTIGAAGTKVGSGYIDGIHQKTFPQGGGQIIVMGEHAGEEKLYNLGANNIPAKQLQRYKELVEQGRMKVIRIYDPDAHPLREFSDVAGNNRVRYVLTADVETKPLDFNHVNRRGGGHFEVDSDLYIKQAIIKDETLEVGDKATDKRNTFKRVYTGDNTLMPILNSVIGKDVVSKMNEMNKLMREARFDEAKALSRSLGINWDTIEGWYDQNRYVNGKKVAPRIDWNQDFYLVPRNRTIYDLDKTLEDKIGKQYFQDGTRSGSDAQQFQVAYNQARDSELMQTIKDIGTQGNPIYKMEMADYVDPIPTMNSALNRAINSTFMDDYKIQAVENWLAEAIPHMKAEADEIRSAPFWHFNNADKGAFKAGTDYAIIDNLMSNRFKIRQFVGMPNKVETNIHSLTQQLADKFYEKLGPEENRSTIGKIATQVPLWALSKWEDPVSGLRSFAFNAKLGLFSVPQFFVQAQTFTNIYAISPRAAAAGSWATMFHYWARINKSDNFLKAYDDYATRLNMFGSKWKTGEWMEANRELRRSGFEKVGGEYQLADDQMQHKFFKNEWNNFLDAGQVFFREGERATRVGAYYTAFREFRDLNPLKVLTDADRAAILNRADTMTNSMSRASASKLNSSVWSLPMQFLTYQVRSAELFFGKRLGGTTQERVLARARLLGLYGAMYGIPGAIGVTGWPFGDSIRQYAVNNGYVPGDSQISDLVMNGYVSWQLAMISGNFDYQKGNQYDVQGRYGNQGLSFLKESLRSDKTMWQLLGGAGVDTFSSTLGHVIDPFWQFARQIVSDDAEGNVFKITPAHFSAMFSEIASVDAATRMIYAMNTGKWLSKNEQYIEDVTGRDALFRTITGLKSQDQNDIWALKNIKDAETKAQKAAEKEIAKDYRRGLDALRDNNEDQAQTYFTNARARMIAAGIPLDRRTQIMANASRGYEAQTLSAQWNWATKNVPFGKESIRMDSIERRLKLREYRNQ